MRYPIFLSWCIMFAAGVNLCAQAIKPIEQWRVPLWATDWGNSPSRVCHTDDKGYTLAGISGDSVIVMHVDKTGAEAWRRVFLIYDTLNSRRGYHQVNALIRFNDNGYILAGYRSMSLQTPDMNGWVIRTDSTGQCLWRRIFGPNTYDALIDTPYVVEGMIAARDGDILVVGEHQGKGWVCRLDKLGNVRWSKAYDSTAVKAVYELPGGAFIAAGRNILKISASGELLWKKAFNPGSESLASAILGSPDGNVIVLGETEIGFNNNNFVAKTALVCFDTAGSVLWNKYYGNSTEGYDFLSRIIALPNNGGYVLAGSKSSGTPNDRGRVWLVRTDIRGDTLWTYSLSLGSEETFLSTIAHDIDLTSDDGFIVTAERYTSSEQSQTFLVKINESGSSGNRVDFENALSTRATQCVMDKNSVMYFDLLGRKNDAIKTAGARPLSNAGIYIMQGKKDNQSKAVIVQTR